MVIHKIESEEDKADQQQVMVLDCKSYWRRLYNANFTSYSDVMNMKTYRYNKYYCPVVKTYHLNLNKW